jgi:hypothetical protein
MKKLISLGALMLLFAVATVTANPLVLLLQSPQAYTMLQLNSAADLSAITAYAANNQMSLIASMINGLDIRNDIMVHPGVKNKIPMPKLKIGNGLRPYSSTPEWKVGDAVYTDRYLEVKPAKRELYLVPEDYRSTYLAWATAPGSTSRDIPFAAFFWDQVNKNVARETNDETAFYGFDGSGTAVLNPAAAYVVGDRVKFATATNNPNAVKDWYECVTNAAAGQTPDTHAVKWLNVTARAITVGLKTRIADGITAAEISPVATGAVTSVAGVALTAFKKLFRAYSPSYKSNGIIISCSYTDWELLMDDLGEKYKSLKDDASANGFLVLPETNKKCIVKPASWLGSSRRLIAGPVFMEGANPKHMNLFMGTDLESDMNNIDTIPKENRTMWAGLNFVIGFNYQDAEAIKVGDQS